MTDHHGLLTDPRVTGLHFSRNTDGAFDIEVCFNGRVFKRTGCETTGQAWRLASEQIYGMRSDIAEKAA